jgi:hypothetical protein
MLLLELRTVPAEKTPAIDPDRRWRLRSHIFAALLMSLAVIVVAGALYFKMTGQHLPFQSSDRAAQKLDPNAFPTAGTIVFTGPDSGDPSVDPTKAEIDDISFKTVSVTWQIRNAATDHIVSSGPGNEVSDALVALQSAYGDASYLIDFFVADQDYKLYGDSAEFSVSV